MRLGRACFPVWQVSRCQSAEDSQGKGLGEPAGEGCGGLGCPGGTASAILTTPVLLQITRGLEISGLRVPWPGRPSLHGAMT